VRGLDRAERLQPLQHQAPRCTAGYFWGFVGLLLAIPLSVLVKMLVLRALSRYERSQLFQGRDPALTAVAERRAGEVLPPQ
jgi:hypothetical protein